MAEFAGFIGDAYTAASIYDNDQELINWYCEIDQRKKEGERGRVVLYPTPGLTLKKESSMMGEVRQVYTPSGRRNMFAAIGSAVNIYDTSFNMTSVGSLSSNSGPVSITDN